MSDGLNSILLSDFYPENLEIIFVEQNETEVHITMKSKTKECKCPKCEKTTSSIHATHHRKVQDLPIFRKRAILDINLYEFNCINPDCDTVSFTETFENFLKCIQTSQEDIVNE